MFAQKLLLPAFAVISVAAAQSASICSQATATINSQADATQYASCSTIKGDVVIGSSASGTIALDGPQQITGDLSCENAGQLITLSSTSIGSIGGNFNLQNLTTLSTLQFSDLTSVKNITWISLPALGALTMTSVISQASGVEISNTFLSSLDGINLMTVNSLDVNNNARLKTFSTQIGNITNMLNIAANGKTLAVEFPNLIWANDMTLRDVANVSFPSLSKVNASLELIENYFDSISAPNLTSVGNTGTGLGGLAIVNNPSLTNISIPELVTVGGAFQVANNSHLDSALSFPALTTVGGAIDFTGNFSGLTLAELNNVKGGFNVESTSSSLDCSTFKSEAGGIIQGTFKCDTNSSPTTKNGSGGSKTGSGSGGSTTTPSGAANALGVSAFAGLGLVGSLMAMLV